MKKRKNKMISGIAYLVAIVLIAFAGVSAFKTYSLRSKVKADLKVDKVIQKEVGPVMTKAKDKESDPLKNLNWDEVKALSPNIVAWITVPGTSVNYPIMKADDNSFYLTHDYAGNKNDLGSIFIDYRQLTDFSSKNTFIYGHNVLMDIADAKFTELNGYLKQDFYSEHKQVLIYTPEKVIQGKVLAAHSDTSDTYSNTRKFDSDEAFNDYLAFMVKHSVIKSDINSSDVKKIVTLWTCTSKPGVNSNGKDFKASESRTFVTVSID